MGKSRVATRRRRTSKTVRRAPIFPSQRRAARQQPAPLAAVSALTGKKRAGELPRPVVWMLWLVGAAALSVAIGFVAGLARPRTRSENQD